MTTRSEPIPDGSLAQETSWVHGLARHLVRDEHLAADVAQDALIVGLDGAAPAAAGTTPRGWLAGITRRLALQALRKRREREVRELLAARAQYGDPERRAAERLHVHEVLARAVRELPEPYRTAVTLRFFEGLSPRAIARLRDQLPAAVRQHVHRGLGLLRHKLDQEFGDRKAWHAMFQWLGLGRPFVPGLPVSITWTGLLAIVVAMLAALVVFGVAWNSRADDATRGAGAASPTPSGAEQATWSSQRDSAQEPRGTPPPGKQPDPPQTLEALQARVERFLQPLVATRAFAGCVLLARGGMVVRGAYGMADHEAGIANALDGRFKLMSVTKSITAVAVMRLVQAGKLSLTDPVGKHLPQWPAAWREVTVHDLLDHTSGIPNLEAEWAQHERSRGLRGLPAWRTFAATLATRELVREAATSRYSNFNFELVGAVAEAASGKPLRQLMSDEVFAAAGMQETGFDEGSRVDGLAKGYFLGAAGPAPSQQDMSMIQAAGGLYSSVNDLCRLDRALREDTLLQPATRTAMLSPRENTFGYACGWSTTPVLGHRCWHHSGGANGYVADFLRFPDDEACVVVLSNYAFAPISRLSTGLAALLFGIEQPQPVQLTAEQRAAAAGVFVDPAAAGRVMFVRGVGEHVLAFDVWPGNERVGGQMLVPVAPGRFLVPFGVGEIVIDASGAVTPAGRLLRAADVRAAWAPFVGPLRAEQEGSGELLVRDGRMRLRTDFAWPREMEFVPLTASVACCLYAEEGGTLLTRREDGLDWLLADGRRVRLRAAK